MPKSFVSLERDSYKRLLGASLGRLLLKTTWGELGETIVKDYLVLAWEAVVKDYSL